MILDTQNTKGVQLQEGFVPPTPTVTRGSAPVPLDPRWGSALAMTCEPCQGPALIRPALANPMCWSLAWEESFIQP